MSKNPNLGSSFLDKNLGNDDPKGFDSGFNKKREKDFNAGVKGFKKKSPTADDDDRDDDRFQQTQSHDLNDIEEEEIDYRKKK